MTNTQSIKAALTSAAALLNTEEATPEAQLLLQHALNVNRAWLIAHEGDALEANNHAVFEALLKRRLDGEPIAYILGYREFYGLMLKVTPDTLIPRADTETLVEAALSKIPPSPASGRGSDNALAKIPPTSFRREQFAKLRTTESNYDETDSDLRQNDMIWDDALKVLDLGTGTGAIALAIAHNRPQTFITAVDASESALKIAQENAQNLNITNINFVQSDWFSALRLVNLQYENIMQKFDLIVSNPPYIEQDDAHLSQGDLRFEPISALASGSDGLDDIRKIIDSAAPHLNPQGWLMLEHGYNQAESVATLLKQAGFTEVGHALDLAGIQRVTLGRLI